MAKRMLRPEDGEALERIAGIWERLAAIPENSTLGLSWSLKRVTERRWEFSATRRIAHLADAL